MKKRLAASLVAMAMALALAYAGLANADQGSVLARPSAASYKALSAKWWQWAASTPFSDNGPFGQSGTDCSENQPEGKVWFLAGQFTSDPATRKCVIPAGRWLFLPVINVECSSLEAEPFYGGTVAERRACVEKDIFAFSELVATLDGRAIVPNLDDYEVTSPNFPIVAVDGNPASIPAGRGFSVSKGVWLLLAPLDRGPHTIEFRGCIAAFEFCPKATYSITVE